ncbi:hypothetical protein C8Q73DRAFT_61464 [Cubamyces lactineus]|nr:hypothetical protein C8Q73DRAFT_61464 [Cubamyces lactineus]
MPCKAVPAFALPPPNHAFTHTYAKCSLAPIASRTSYLVLQQLLRSRSAQWMCWFASTSPPSYGLVQYSHFASSFLSPSFAPRALPNHNVYNRAVMAVLVSLITIHI